MTMIQTSRHRKILTGLKVRNCQNCIFNYETFFGAGRKGKEDDKQESEEAAFKYEDVYKDSEEVYGFKLKPPSAEDARMYER